MNNRGSSIDSFLYHLIGEEESVSEFKRRLHEESIENSSLTEKKGGLQSTGQNPPATFDFQGDDTNLDIPEFSFPEFENIETSEEQLEAVEDTPSYDHGIPVLIQVRRLDWRADDLAGFKQSSRLGDVITGHASRSAIDELGKDPDVIRIDVSRDTGEEELDVSIPAVRADKVHSPHVNEKGSHAIVGVIDGGLDILHEAFLDENGQTRILELWDQFGTSDPPPLDEKSQPFSGTIYTAGDINNMISTGVVPQELGRDPSGHGTHVTSIAAGRAVGAFSGGMAPEAKIVFVRPKLKTPQGDPNSIGYSMSHVDALAYIDRVARREGLPVAVNISLGMNAGAHDGSSTLEAAFDNFTSNGRIPGRVIVKSAGNAADDSLHANIQIGQGQSEIIQWQSKNIRRRDDVIEIWYNSADDLGFSLEAPGTGGQTVILDNRSSPPRIFGRFTNGNDFSMTLDKFNRDNGDTRLSIRLTRGSESRIINGLWSLHVKANTVPSGGNIDAWIERTRGKPIKFLSQHSTRDGTLSIPGTANSVISVSALDRGMTGPVTSFSSRGATRDGRARPDIGAPGDNIEAADSGTKHGIIAKPGTSMAAPHVTGALALLLSKQQKENPNGQLNANQMRAALIQSSRGFNGRWNNSRGWGELDTEALLKLFK